MTDTRRIVYQTDLFQGEYVKVDAIDYPYLNESGTATYSLDIIARTGGTDAQ